MGSFSLLEVLLVTAILVITVGTGIWWTANAITQSELTTTSETIVGLLRRTQALAKANEEDTGEGLSLAQSQIIFFRGDSLITTTETEIFTLPSGFTLENIQVTGGGNEITFGASTGETAQPATFQIRKGSGAAITISISSLGLIQWL